MPVKLSLMREISGKAEVCGGPLLSASSKSSSPPTVSQMLFLSASFGVFREVEHLFLVVLNLLCLSQPKGIVTAG